MKNRWMERTAGGGKVMKKLKSVGSAILNALSGSLVPLIPVLIGAAMFKTLLAVFGPDVLGWIHADSDLYILLSFVADAGFYFLPIYAGYTSATYFKVSGLLGMFLGAILIHPTFAALDQSLVVFGLTIPSLAYSGTILPILLSCWIMSYVYKGVERVIPKVLQDVFVPFLTILVMLPITLCLVAPLGTWLGQFICDFVLSLGSLGGIGTILSMALIGAFWQYIVMSGMHWIFITTIITILATGEVDALIFPACTASSFSIGGMCLGAFLALRGTEDKAKAMSCVIAQMIGGVTEPGLYGVGFQYKKPLAGMMAGGFCGALYAGITGVVCTNLVPVASFLVFLSFTGASAMNLVNEIIAAAIAFVVAAVVTFVLMKSGQKKKEA